MSTTRKIKADYIDGVEIRLNYIKKSSANQLITDWNRYLNSGSRPTDGTGGSPTANVTWTRTTSTPIEGEGSFLYTKTNTISTQGEGISYDYTIPNGQQARVQRVGFDWKIVSGTYSGGTSSTDSDLIVYMYRVTATGRLIEPSVIKLDGGVVGVNYSYRGEFQTDYDATEYRFIIHSATTSTSDFTVQFDNFYIGPSTNSYGAVITQWQSYTPVMTGAGTGTSTINGKWRRVGDSMELQIYNAMTAAGTGVDYVKFSIPSGYTIDTSKNPSVANYGSALTNSIEASNQVASTMVYPFTTTTLAIWDNGSNSDVYKATDYRNASTAILRATIPIVGWGATAILGQDADTRIVSSYSTGAPPTGTLNNSVNTVIFGTKLKDSHGTYNQSTGTYTIPVSGSYNIAAGFRVNGTYALDNENLIYIFVNGAEISRNSLRAGGAITSINSSIAINAYPLNSGDLVTIRSQSAATTPTYSATVGNNYFSISRESGPSQTAASEALNLKYVNTAGTSVTSATVDIPFATKVYDSHGTFDGTTFTANTSGKFEFSVNLFSANVTQTTTQSFNLIFLVTATPEGLSGVSQLKQVNYGNGASKAFSVNATETYNMIAGNTLKVRAASDTTVALSTTAGRNTLTVKKID